MTNQMTIEIETTTGVWTDISSYVYQRDPVQITQGRSDEQSQAGPSRLSFTLDNRTGRFSPRNPLSDLYGKIGRNTPVRCKIDNGAFTRFYGEIASWPPKWNPSHSDNYVPIEAYGILRRLGQGQPAISNALRDYILGQSTLAAYYPLSGGEETKYSQNIAPGITGSFRATTGVTFKYGVDMGAAWLGSGMELNLAVAPAYMEGSVKASASNVALDFVFQSPALGVLDLRLFDTTDSYWNLLLNTSGDAGTLQVQYYDDINGLITNTATSAIPELQDTEIHTCRLLLKTVAGPAVNYEVYIDGVLTDSGTNGLTATLTGFYLFRLYYSRYTNQTVMNLAHLTAWADNTLANIPTALEYKDAAFAYSGETAIDRITRVCSDGDIPLGTVGTSSESALMGPQFTESRLDQIRDAEATDMGILVEHRSASALLYRSRSALYNATPTFTLDYGAGHVSPPLEPVDDDQTTRNDVTATKREGGSARYCVDTGPLSTLDPPDGVGRYDTDITVNVETDGMLEGVAAWVANIGTLDKARWPSVTVNLSSPNISSTLKDQVKSINVGEWFTITNMKKAFVYDDINLIVVGYTETIDPFVHTITFFGMPAEPYTVAVYDTARYDADNSTLTSNITSTATSLSATKSGTTLWTTDGTMVPFDINVGGERIRVGSVTGSSSPQTLGSLTRSINGVVKAQTAGTEIVLWDTPRYAL